MTTASIENDVFLHGKDRNYSYDEYCEITDKAFAAHKRGDIEEYNRIILSIPLSPFIAKKLKRVHGKQYLFEIGADLTEANLEFGEGWLDNAED